MSKKVSDNAMVSGNAQVFGNARVSGNALVSDDALIYGIMRSDMHCFVYVPCTDGIWRVQAECRNFTMEEARQHWSMPNCRDEKLCEETNIILDCLEKLKTVKPNGV